MLLHWKFVIERRDQGQGTHYPQVSHSGGVQETVALNQRDGEFSATTGTLLESVDLQREQSYKPKAAGNIAGVLVWM
jgi:hypothetical protein